MIEDLGSTNGCFVNGQRLMGPHALRNGELIMLGENVGVVYEATGMDMNIDATIAAGPGQFLTPPPPQVTISAPQAITEEPRPAVTWEQPAPAQAYVGQVPEGPVDVPMEAVPAKKSSRTWLWAGCGCLLLLCCVVVGGAYAFDNLNLYCQPPFDGLFSLFGFCAP
jgi:hypothetical protein